MPGKIRVKLRDVSKMHVLEPPRRGDLRVAVIGGAGKMGEWFVRYFSACGTRTVISDARSYEAGLVSAATGAELAETNIDAVRDSDVVIISVPMDRVPQVVAEVAPNMKRGSILAEISSVKRNTVEALRKMTNFGIQPLSIHPLFGPSSESLKGKTIAVVPVVNRDVESQITRRLFAEAGIVISELDEHDRAMAVVLSLTYFVNLTLALAMSEEDIHSIKMLSGSTFTVQLVLVESVVGENPGLIESLMRENTLTELYIDRFLAEAASLRETSLGRSGDLHTLIDSLKSSLARDPDFPLAEKRRHKAFEALSTCR